jgi:uncharacterized BrkB/YihY/UPF0761 family membrane protein
MGYLLGVILLVLGALVIVFGDKALNVKGGAILKTFSMPTQNAKFLKWVVGVLCIWFGAALLFGGGKL